MTHSILPWYEEELVDKVEIRQGGKRVERFPGYETEEDVKRRLRDLGHTGTFEVIGLDPSGRPLPDKGEMVVNAAARPLANLLGSTRHARGPRTGGGLDQGMFLEHERDRQQAMEAARRENEQRLDEERRRLDAERQRTVEEQRKAAEEAAAVREAAAREAVEARERAFREMAETKERATREAIEARERAAREAIEAREAAAREQLVSKDALATHLMKAADEKASLATASAQMAITQAQTMYTQQLEALRAQTATQLESISRAFGTTSQQVVEQAARNENMLVAAFSGQINQASAEVAMWRTRCEQIEQNTARRERELDERYELRIENVRQESERKIAEIRAQANLAISQAEDRAKRVVEDAASRLERKEAEHALERTSLLDRVENMRTEVERARNEVSEMRMLVLRAKLQNDGGDKTSRRVSEMREMVAIAKEAGADPAKIVQAEFGIEPPEESGSSGVLDGIMSAVLSGAIGGRRGGVAPNAPALPPATSSGGLETEPI